MCHSTPHMIWYWCLTVAFGPSRGLLRDPSLHNLSDLDIDLSRSFKVKSDGGMGLPILKFIKIKEFLIRDCELTTLRQTIMHAQVLLLDLLLCHMLYHNSDYVDGLIH